jgi:hypothetical protein
MKTETQIKLDRLGSLYLGGSIVKDVFLKDIFLLLQAEQNRVLHSLEREERKEFLSWFYPRMVAAVDKYREKDGSFHSCLFRILMVSLKEFKRVNSQHKTTEFAYWNESLSHNHPYHHYVTDEEADYPSDTAVVHIENKKEVLMLLLKGYFHVTDNFVERAAPVLCMPKEEIFVMINKMKLKRAERDAEIAVMIENVHSQHFRVLSYEHQIQNIHPDCARYAVLKKRLERHRQRYQAMRERLKKVKRSASNREVAEVLGLPKGTVDANLAHLQQRYKHLLNDGD